MRRLGWIIAPMLLAGLGLGSLLSRAPRHVIWAWERPEDLSALLGQRTEIAFWAGTLHLARANDSGVRLDFLPRTQALRLPAGAVSHPVIRLVSGQGIPAAALGPRLATDAAAEIVAAARRYHPAALQIDFDAARSERGFYRRLMQELRAQLPPGTRLSMTALASWCIGDRWLAGMPVDEVVPMFFRMGSGAGAIRAELARGRPLPEPLCRDAIGVAIDEPLSRRPRAQTVYHFNPESWSPQELNQVFKRI